MARVRVHELAKELGMNSKELIDRILKLGIPVKNHMSALDDSAVTKIRAHLQAGTPEKVEEKRIGRRVIRRRKKAEEPKPAPAEPQPEPVEVSAEAPPIQEHGREEPPAAEAVEISPAEAEPETPPAPEEAPSTETAAPEAAPEMPVAPEPHAAPPTAEETDAAAIAPPQVATPEASEPEPAPSTPEPAEPSAEGVPEEAMPADTPPVTEAAPEPAAPPQEAPEPTTDKEAVPEEQPAQEAPQEAAKEGPAEEEEDRAKKKKGKRRKRKRRKDEPAKIIRLPELIPGEAEEEPEIPAPAARFAPDEQVSREPLRKKKVRSDKEDAGKRPRRARKEVVGREDLYSKKELRAQAERGRGASKKGAPKEAPKPAATVPKAAKRRIRIDEAITVANLAKQMGVKATEIIKKLLLLGLPANINQAIDFDAAALVASEFGYEVEKAGFEEEDILQATEDKPEDLQPRPPVVTVMGHVDHGKTSLLDAIRHTNVIDGEAGGITQHIGAYFVEMDGGRITFLDTPGHEAFTAMRARGAKVTDLVILVVAADDGVMQQTIEAINHSKAAQVPIMVAINKIDKPNANVDRVKRELAEHGLIPEEWGGDTTMVEISAKKRMGIEELMEMVLLQAELLELKANPNKPARGRVIEAKLDKGRGPVATVLVQEGTLREGDVYVCGTYFGRVRSLFDDKGRRISEAGPSVPVEVLGLSGVPNAGDDFIVLADEKQAKQVAEHRQMKHREKELSRSTKVTLERLYEQIQEGQIKEVNVILKSDVQGSLEAIRDSIQKLSTQEVKVSLIHAGTGAISEGDVMLASASNAIIIGFNVRADAKAQELAEQEQVDIRYYDVIYQIISDIKEAMVGLLEPDYREEVLGRVEVRQTFHISRIGTVAGCYVTDGKVERNAKVRLIRDGVVVWDGKLASLKRFKDDVREVSAGFECGITIENFNDIKVGDQIEVYKMVEVKPTLGPEDGNA
ncbi:bacterial translation initiation factor 2 (bIF-2) [Desulfacinum hydrothermale DSM 13146]|uniref:Translation initiation factor IF-2 n=1 Tax=Desulfacinum hydrothermale DSM 13146 TaxID=1121390 RepID=A0A1W1X8Y4_9BACT|nr:translation initiation factor IF-2 [Desulfacinum hydrothermale]SMC20396.1 bacterial translation initiation factor 2 (bIF-2) [Desulfacinum hydrothermale DSM 13146]